MHIGINIKIHYFIHVFLKTKLKQAKYCIIL